MNRNRKRFDLQLFTGSGTSISRNDAEALIPVQESHEIIQGVVEQSAVLQRGRRLANMTAAQYKMPVLDLLPVAYFVNGEGGSAKKKLTTMAWDKKVIYAEEIAVIVPISEAIRKMLAPTGMNFTITERQIALIPARKADARSRTITGTVKDSHEAPLAGVAVTIEGASHGAVTEASGNFSLTVPDRPVTLNFTYLGYVSKKIAVPASQNQVTVFLS